MSSCACTGHPGQTERFCLLVAEPRKGLPARSQPLSQKSRSEKVREVAAACGAVSGDGSVYPTLVTQPHSRASRDWPLAEEPGLASASSSAVTCGGRLWGDPDVSAFPETPLRPPSLLPTVSCSCSAGRNEKGQLGHGDTKRVEAPKLIEGLSHEVIVSAACGRNHTLALTGKERLVSSESGRRPHGPPWALGGVASVALGQDQKDAQRAPVGASRGC